MTYGLSEALGAGELQGLPRAFGGPIYTCPSGSVAIVREFLAASELGGPKGSTLIWIKPSGVAQLLIGVLDTPDAWSMAHLVSDAVLMPGDQLILATDLNDLTWYVSGAELYTAAGTDTY